METALGARVLGEFQQLADVHRDGWGAVWRRSDGVSHYRSNTAASRDAMFGAMTAQPASSVVVHERWASPGIAVSLDNQQPFASNGVAFAHNGTIANDEGNIVHRSAAYRASLGLPPSAVMSDSRLYADLFFLHLREPSADGVLRALRLAVGALREDYPRASFNAVVETVQATFAVQAHETPPNPGAGVRRVYEKVGWAGCIASYYDLRYTTLTHEDGSKSAVASSSGYGSNDAWTLLGNDTVLVLPHGGAGVYTVPLKI
jgi:predicted glutamine amidotransferase